MDPAIKVELVIGNHDTYPKEKDFEIFRSTFPDTVPYGAFDQGGAHFVRLNGGGSGDLDAPQAAWLEQHMKEVLPEQTLVVFVHQPPFSSPACERGIGDVLQKVLADRTGEVWVVAGHGHANGIQVFELPKTKLVRQCVTRSGKIHGDAAGPGYWIFGMSKGHVMARVFRKFGAGFSVAPAPELSKAQPIPQLFGKLSDRVSDGGVWAAALGSQWRKDRASGGL